MRQFSDKMDNFDFFGQIRPKMDIWLEIYKTNFGIRISILEKHVCQFLDKTNNSDFFGPNLPKKEFTVGNSEN